MEVIGPRGSCLLGLEPEGKGVVEALFRATAADEANVAGVGHNHLSAFGLGEEGKTGCGGNEDVVLGDADPEGAVDICGDNGCLFYSPAAVLRGIFGVPVEEHFACDGAVEGEAVVEPVFQGGHLG